MTTFPDVSLVHPKGGLRLGTRYSLYLARVQAASYPLTYLISEKTFEDGVSLPVLQFFFFYLEVAHATYL